MAKRRGVRPVPFPYCKAMKTMSSFDEYSYHTWRDVGGFFGLIMDGAFCVFVVIAALAMMVLATIILGLDHLASPLTRLLTPKNG